MTTVFSALLITLLILVVMWVGVFGSAGRILTRHSSLSGAHGFLIGSIFGPLGLCFILWRNRTHRPFPASNTNVSPSTSVISSDPPSYF